MASSTQNTSMLIDGNGVRFAGSVSDDIRDYSNMSDTVDFTNNSPTNYHTRMMGGNDVVTLSDINVGGFSNKANGNLGNDEFRSKLGSTTRDFILGGSENDLIDLSNSARGADWQNGNYGEDQIIGAASTTMSVLRGGADNDVIQLMAGSKHIVVGDLGTDELDIGGATARIVCRTDNGAAAQNIGEADVIFGFDNDDKVFVPGVDNLNDLQLQQVGQDTYLMADSFTNGTIGSRYIAQFHGRNALEVRGYINGGQVIIGDMADQAYAALTPENFLTNPELGGMFA